MIRIGIVGCGRILNYHLNGYKLLREKGFDNFRITALCARKEDDALMFRKRGEGPPPRPVVTAPGSSDPLGDDHVYLSDFQDDVDVQVFTDYKEMVKNGPVDAVNDFTTLAVHHLVGKASLEAGKHLLSQKPLAVSVKAGKLMVEMAEAKGLVHGIFEDVRYAEIARALAWATQSGMIGKPQLMLGGSIGGMWSPDSVVADTPWRHQKMLAGGGGTIDIGVHQFHRAQFALGEVDWVQAVTPTFQKERHRRDIAGKIIETVEADVDDTYLATIGFKNGAIGQFLWSWAFQKEAVAIPGAPIFYGDKGCIKGGELASESRAGKLIDLYHGEADPAEKERHFPKGITSPPALNQLDWLRAIEAGTKPETSGRHGLTDLACAFAMLESDRAGRRVAVDDVLSGAVNAYQKEIDEHYGL